MSNYTEAVTASTEGSAPYPVFDPFGAWDIAGIVVGATAYFINLVIFIVVILRKSTFLPFRTKNIRLLVILELCGLSFWVLQIITDNTRTVLFSRGACVILFPWLMYAVGLLLHMIIVNYRLYILYWLLVLKRPIGGFKFHALFSLTYIPTLLYVIASSASTKLVYTTQYPDPGQCMFNYDYRIFFATALYYLVGIAVLLNILLRNVRKTFNEYRESLASTLAFTVFAIVIGVANAKVVSAYGWGRFLMSMIALVAVNVFFWVTMAKPLYAYVFNREEYLASFKQNLALDGLDNFQSSNPSRSGGGSTTLQHSVYGDEEQGLELTAPRICTYPPSVSEAELTSVKSLFTSLTPLGEKNYLV
ncbi:hypothetical protein BJ085DRAFT_37125 [Dimargaris cristalligena]|uniref:G-protein coupled receptors family 1 profile domain-containing protein n=1 Tax=Dimargaris cristalligena TaxID=215637 RepID=A0A4P9ZWD5_9FUNG|nr:hypothetical protein BJ085DRAFT_37125 [Dimargaris cristalligena]|eukprot:RKP37271.1 hypothetical protein BJ085DRAFT_37125 [Dimargaris cristalligena]